MRTIGAPAAENQRCTRTSRIDMKLSQTHSTVGRDWSGGSLVNNRVRFRISGAAILSCICGLVFGQIAAAEEPTFRIRSDFAAPLNADAGWAGDANEAVAVFADQPFRLRMEVVKGDLKEYGSYVLQARRNGGEWKTVEAHDFPYPQSEVSYDFGSLRIDRLPQHWTGRISDGQEIWLTQPPWPVPDFSYEIALETLSANTAPIDFLFYYFDATEHFGVRFDPAGQVSVYGVTGGEVVSLATSALTEPLSGSLEIKIELEDGGLSVALNDDQITPAMPFEAIHKTRGFGMRLEKAPDGVSRVKIEDVTIETSPKSPPISIVSTAAYPDGALTQNVLSGAEGRFTPGHGVSLSDRTPGIESDNKHSEYEWPLVIRRFVDGAELNETGDVFEFRMTSGIGLPLEGPDARVRLKVPDNHLGGTFVESPGRIGPWQSSNGDLYFVMEPAESDNKFMMVKSEDAGLSWAEVDGLSRPLTGDLEAVDARLVGDQIHILHQITESTFYHVFNTSDHLDAPDQWALVDELAATGEAISQSNAMVVRSDGSVAAFFLTDNLHAAIRDRSGNWGSPIPIVDDAAVTYAGPQAVLGKDDTIHLVYWSSEGEIAYRQMRPGGTLTTAKILATGAGVDDSDIGAVLPLVYNKQTDTVITVFRLSDGRLWERSISHGEVSEALRLVTKVRVVTDAVDSQQAGADLMVFDDEPVVLFIDEETQSIYSTRRVESSLWSNPVLRVGEIEGSWVRAAIIKDDQGVAKLGFVYDAGSRGGAGMNMYAEFVPQ